MNLPNSLTVTRIFLVPLLVVVLLTKFEGRQILGVPKELVGAAIFGLASLTDWLDGYLARRRKQVTALGQVIDPLADKLLISAALISLVQMDLAPAWMVAIIIGREFAVTGAAQPRVRARRRDSGLAARQDQDGRAGGGDPRADPVARATATNVLYVARPGGAVGGRCVAALVSAADYFRRFNRRSRARASRTSPWRGEQRSIAKPARNGPSSPQRRQRFSGLVACVIVVARRSRRSAPHPSRA